jgi:cytochrome c oxidase subunit 2
MHFQTAGSARAANCEELGNAFPGAYDSHDHFDAQDRHAIRISCSQIIRECFSRVPYDRPMKRTALLSLALGLSLSFGALLSAAASADTAATAAQTFTIDASASTMFTPSQITVHVGQPVELKIVGKDGVHGIQSSALGIPATMITPGSTKIITFTPNKVGTYVLPCTIPCGPHHTDMKITINVVS